MSARLAAAMLAAVSKNPTSVDLVEQVRVATTPFDVDVADGTTSTVNAGLAPVTADQVTGTDVVSSDEVCLIPGASVPAFLDETTKVEINGVRHNITRKRSYGSDAALVGVELIIRRQGVMTLRIYDDTIEAGANAIWNKADDAASAGKVRIYSGSQPALNGVVTGTLLAEFTLSDPAFGVAAASGSGGVKTLNGLPKTEASAPAAGTAGYGVLMDGDDNIILTGTVTATGGGGDFTIDNVSIALTQEVQLTGYTGTLPQS